MSQLPTCASAANSNTSPPSSSSARTRLVLLVSLSSCSARLEDDSSPLPSMQRQPWSFSVDSASSPQ